MQPAGRSGNQAAGNPLALVEETLGLEDDGISQLEVVRQLQSDFRVAAPARRVDGCPARPRSSSRRHGAR